MSHNSVTHLVDTCFEYGSSSDVLSCAKMALITTRISPSAVLVHIVMQSAIGGRTNYIQAAILQPSALIDVSRTNKTHFYSLTWFFDTNIVDMHNFVKQISLV